MTPSTPLFFFHKLITFTKKTEQVKMVHDIRTLLSQQSNEYNMISSKVPLDKDGNTDRHYQAKMDRMMDHIFGTMNWLRYLIDKNVISDPEVYEYFDDGIVEL